MGTTDPVIAGQYVSSDNELVIVNELLCFISNKIDKLTAAHLIKLCCDTFSESDIETAKKNCLCKM